MLEEIGKPYDAGMSLRLPPPSRRKRPCGGAWPQSQCVTSATGPLVGDVLVAPVARPGQHRIKVSHFAIKGGLKPSPLAPLMFTRCGPLAPPARDAQCHRSRTCTTPRLSPAIRQRRARPIGSPPAEPQSACLPREGGASAEAFGSAPEPESRSFGLSIARLRCQNSRRLGGGVSVARTTFWQSVDHLDRRAGRRFADQRAGSPGTAAMVVVSPGGSAAASARWAGGPARIRRHRRPCCPGSTSAEADRLASRDGRR
jgi:hypothetical protein